MKFIFVLGVLLIVAAIALTIVSLILKKFGDEDRTERLGAALISFFCGIVLCVLYETFRPEYESVRATRYYIEEVVTYRDSIPYDTVYTLYYKK